MHDIKRAHRDARTQNYDKIRTYSVNACVQLGHIRPIVARLPVTDRDNKLKKNNVAIKCR